MATTYRHTGVLVLPAFVVAGLIAAPFSGFLGPWAMLIGLPVTAMILLLVDRAVEPERYDLGALAGMLLLAEVGVFVALLVKVARAQGESIGWWLPVVEAIALVVVLRAAVRALRRQRRQGKELAWKDLSFGEVWKVGGIEKLAVEHAGKLLAGQPDVDRTAAVRDLRRRTARRPELVPVLLTTISQRPGEDPRVLDLAGELVTEAAATSPKSRPRAPAGETMQADRYPPGASS
jgi:hypothetical protein